MLLSKSQTCLWNGDLQTGLNAHAQLAPLTGCCLGDKAQFYYKYKLTHKSLSMLHVSIYIIVILNKSGFKQGEYYACGRQTDRQVVRQASRFCCSSSWTLEHWSDTLIT